MHIKRFTGKRTEEVLKRVRAEFGEDALILSTRKKKGLVEVIAAVDFDAERLEERLRKEEILDRELKGLRYELSELRTLFTSVVGEMEVRKVASIGPGSLNIYRDLTSKGIDHELAVWIVRKAASLKGGDLRERSLRVVRETVKVSNPLKDMKKPGLIALVGPTGSGKTTTIAKMAGKLKRTGRRIGLVSLDNRRPGSKEMLKAYSDLIGVSMGVPSTKEEFHKLLWDYRDMDYILIDTPGKNPRDPRALSELQTLLNGGLPIRIGLVLSLTARDESFADACRGFGRLPVDSLIFTRFDETPLPGPIVNASVRMGKPVAFLCNGQRVPEDIKILSEDLLESLICRGRY